MKFNKWTLGLAAVGAVSLASTVRADEMKALNTALSNTTISGYLDVGANWTAGDQPSLNQYNSVKKTDRFSLNDVVISLDKPLDESPWAAGYHIDFNTGEDAVGISSLYSSSYNNNSYNYAGVRQAYVALRTPLGNGIDWKFGVMDGITGYEGNTSYLNPNISRSFGYAVNPATYVGMLGTYKICDVVSVTAGLINPTYSTINISSKSYVGSVALTAPDSFGFLKGSALNLQTIQSFDARGINNYSVNGTFNTPLAGLKFGLAYDYVQVLGSGHSGDGSIYGIYGVYQATDKLSVAVRGEYLDGRWYTPVIGAVTGIDGDAGEGSEVSATVQYDLWANVVSRVELRWDHIDHYGEYGASGNNSDLISLSLSLVYKF